VHYIIIKRMDGHAQISSGVLQMRSRKLIGSSTP